MLKLKYILSIFVLVCIGCAKRGSISGGLKDTIAPVFETSFPKNFSTNFKENTIKLTFDEYVKLNDLSKQLVVSPPMKYDLVVLPNYPSKNLTIKIIDTLQLNTTYNLNFGQSITDNNEGNPLNQFKYIFSTGSYIDSLTVKGTVKDAFNKKIEPPISIMLYEINGTYNDSVIYKKPPTCISSILDSLKTFTLENLKPGKYLLIALKDLEKNNKFNPNKDKIAFYNKPISVPNDTLFELKLFKEELPFKTYKPIHAAKGRLILPYIGEAKNPMISLKSGAELVSTIITKFPGKDSLQVWFKSIKADSLSLIVEKENYKANFKFRQKNLKKDSLNIKSKQLGIIDFKEKFILQSSTPLVQFDKSKMKLISSDSTQIDLSMVYDAFNQELNLDFNKSPSKKYKLSILPGAFVDFFENKNDTLSYNFSTKSYEDYGNLTIQLQNVKRFPIIIELVNNSGDVIETAYSNESTKIDFNLLSPSILSIRLIYDDNKNKKWDTGNFLEKKQPEEVLYFSKEIDVRSNWDIEQIFDLNNSYLTDIKEKYK